MSKRTAKRKSKIERSADAGKIGDVIPVAAAMAVVDDEIAKIGSTLRQLGRDETFIENARDDFVNALFAKAVPSPKPTELDTILSVVDGLFQIITSVLKLQRSQGAAIDSIEHAAAKRSAPRRPAPKSKRRHAAKV